MFLHTNVESTGRIGKRRNLQPAYIGCYTRGNNGGIFASGEGNGLTLAASRDLIENPSFLAVHPSKPILYGLSEVMDAGSGSGGAITAFKIEDHGRLTKLRTIATLGGAPVHLSLSRRTKALLFVNYCGDMAGWIPLGDDGAPSGPARVVQQPGTAPGTGRQDAPHPHSIVEEPNGARVLVPDLGLDRVFVHNWVGESGCETLELRTEVTLPRGCGPRDLAFHPEGRWAFVTGELDSTVHVLAVSPNEIALSGSQGAFGDETHRAGNTTAAVRVHPSGNAVYVSNRGADTVNVFSFDAKTGQLTMTASVPAGGKSPRHMALTSGGGHLYVANTDSNLVTVFAVENGGLELRAEESFQVPSPACVLPAG